MYGRRWVKLIQQNYCKPPHRIIPNSVFKISYVSYIEFIFTFTFTMQQQQQQLQQQQQILYVSNCSNGHRMILLWNKKKLYPPPELGIKNTFLLVYPSFLYPFAVSLPDFISQVYERRLPAFISQVYEKRCLIKKLISDCLSVRPVMSIRALKSREQATELVLPPPHAQVKLVESRYLIPRGGGEVEVRQWRNKSPWLQIY